MSGSDDDRSAFEKAMADVTPLREGPQNVPPAPPRRAGPERGPPAAPAFERGADANGAWGIAAGVDRAHLRALRAGTPTERSLDLHGLREDAARAAVQRVLRAAHAEGVRCVAVVHGRGRHSQGEAVLREALPGWLCEPPLAALVLAFAPAPAREGGPGATRVLLRRPRT